GLPPLRLADDIPAADLPPLTLHAERLGPAALASVVARLWGLTAAQHADAWVLRRPR
ncbi:MAG: hypothetical protein RLZZ127_3309, partial [Planctomycetota bacterium]